MNDDWPEISYGQARAACEAGQKLHLGGRTLLVRRTVRSPQEGMVLWITDERTRGDHGLLLFPDGSVEAK